MTTPKASRGQGGPVMQPKVTQEEAGSIMGEQIPDSAWLAISWSFEEYGRRAQVLAASNTTKSNRDAESWFNRHKDVCSSLDRAMKAVDAARTRHVGFLEEASNNLAEATLGHSAGANQSARAALDQAYELMLRAITLVERAKTIVELAEPQAIKITDVQSRDELVRDIYTALVKAGISPKVKSGFWLDIHSDQSGCDSFTPFERLIHEVLLSMGLNPGASFRQLLRKTVAKA